MFHFFHHRHDGPCKHMEVLLNRAADGTARGLWRWYALAHAARCTPCREFLDGLREMIEAMRRRREGVGADVVQRLSAVVRESAP